MDKKTQAKFLSSMSNKSYPFIHFYNCAVIDGYIESFSSYTDLLDAKLELVSKDLEKKKKNGK